MLKAYNILVQNNPLLLSWLKDSRAIYDQALYHLRQSYFNTKEQGKISTPSYNQLYHLVSSTNYYKDSTLDAPVKAQIIRQASNNWKAFIKASIAYKNNPDKFTGIPKCLNIFIRIRITIF